MAEQPLDYSSGSTAKRRFGLGKLSLFLILGGIVVGAGSYLLGDLIGFGERIGGGPGILVALIGIISGLVLIVAGVIVGIVALIMKTARARR